MPLSEHEIRRIVDDITAQLRGQEPSSGGAAEVPGYRSGHPSTTRVERHRAAEPGAERPLAKPDAGADRRGIFETVDEAVAAAGRAQREIRSIELRQRIIANQRRLLSENDRVLAEEAVAETGLGNVRDKVLKNRLCAEKTPGTEDLNPEILSGDHGLTLTELAPWGVIGAVTPSTNPGATIINNGISMIAAGNAVVFGAHPMAKGVTNHAIDLMNRASEEAGGPGTLLTAVAEPSIETAQTLFHHEGIDLLVVTGGGGVVKAAQESDKRVIAAGPGNPPAVVDASADLERAAADIVAGASFDNNIVCTCEKEILAEESIADALLEELQRNDAVLLDTDEAEVLARAILVDYPGESPRMNREFIGKDAPVLAERIGKRVPDSTRLLIAETDRHHPFAVLELLTPCVPFIRCPDVDTAIDWAIELEHGFRHTACMHSKILDHLHRMAVEIDCSIFVKNGPNLAGLGFGGEGPTAMTISTPTGEGPTSARTFVRRRRCVLVDYFRIV
ncbi:MAG: aldehyde dehydrogenase family protein [Gemmatimonadota bacterium]|nr:aldehyde dehydrogenase family protein [Gemmatimonadota bacterium]